jgi:aryl-alcohol dehydrogenase-like predicted oxidoreductase
MLAAAPAALSGAQALAVPEYRRGGMFYRRLGNTDLYPSLLSFGSHTDPSDRVKNGDKGTVLTPQGQQRRDRIIARAFDLGVNLLDVYANEGQWEPASRMVKGRRDKILVSLAHEISPVEVDNACRMFGHVDLYRFHTAEIDSPALENWDTLRKAKEAGKVRAIGIATHVERTMMTALLELEGIDYLFFPYNFIHARADYGQLFDEARRRGVGLIGMKPLASGSIMKLDPLARAGAKPEFEALQLWQSNANPVLPAAVAELTKTLGRMPGETLCMAAMRFVYSRPFLSTAITGMFEDRLLEDNYKALLSYREMTREERAALKAARELAGLLESRWLPEHYRWLDEQWRGLLSTGSC